MDRTISPTVTELHTGIWHSTYRYPSSGRNGLFEGQHFVRLGLQGEECKLESLPNSNKSFLLIELKLNGRYATGTWRERTEHKGYYKGRLYEGALQLVIDDDGRHMAGKWVGAGKDLKLNVGAWELTFVGDRVPGTDTL